MYRNSIPNLPLSAALLALSACGGSREANAPVLPPPDPPGALIESEPNDDAFNANYIGELRVGDYVTIEGEISECCIDPYDGFAFYAAEPLQLTIILTEFEIADLDFCIYDPMLDEMVACWETDAHPESGVFSIGLPADMHLVVASYAGSSWYSLEIYADHLGAAPDPPAPPGRDTGLAPTVLSHERFAEYHAPITAQRDVRHYLLVKDGEEEHFIPLQPEEAPGSH